MEELANEHLEHAEHAHHAVEEGDSFMITVSATIAALAVVAAVVASLETVETSNAIAHKNEAVLMQGQASDAWAFYQAKSIKQKLSEIAALSVPDKADDLKRDAKRYAEESNEISKQAKEFEARRDEKLEEGERHEHRHHRLTYAATLVHVGIAIATLAIIMKGRRWPFHGALGLAGVGVLVAISSYFI